MSEFGFRPGRVGLRSAGPIAFGPDGILFLADNAASKVFAVEVADPGSEGGTEPLTWRTSTRWSARSWAASRATS